MSFIDKRKEKNRMNETITKQAAVRKVVGLLKDRGRKCTQMDTEAIIDAFWEVIINALSEGNSVKLNGYATIGTRHMAERKAKNLVEDKEVIVPEHYKVHFKAGSKLNHAAMAFTQKELGGKK